jgi:predicted glutamine amidotransferase
MCFRKVFLGLLLLLISSQSAFACRLEGVMGPRQPSPEIWQEENAFLHASLIDDANSLQKESEKRPANQGNNYDLEDLITAFRERGNMDGWGMVRYACKQDLQSPQVFKNTEPAFADPQYNQAVRQSLTKSANIMMAHIRRVADHKQVTLANAHPFIYQNWSFMHNGDLTGAFSPVVKEKINRYREQLGGGPKGTTDSEHVFYFFLANLYEATGTIDRKQISIETVQKIFAQSIKTLIANSDVKFSPLNGSVLNVQGEIQALPVCNFVLSDGEHLLAFRHGLNMFLGQKTLSNGQHLYLVASEKRHAENEAVQWLALPENHILTISWNASGDPVPALQPLTRLAP